MFSYRITAVLLHRSWIPTVLSRVNYARNATCQNTGYQYQALLRASYSTAASPSPTPSTPTPSAAEHVLDLNDKGQLRNIGISAHIDSGKTTLTERILFYTGRIEDIHEVKGSDEVGATMDHMDLEREKGITIQSAATFVQWKDVHFNIIDTPGHIDFTIEVERALKVMDGAILIVCGVGGVQTQTLTVDRQMNRYQIPRIVFINKLDRLGCAPFNVEKQIKTALNLNAALVQLPIGLEEHFEGVVDVIERKAYYFEGYKGNELLSTEVPEKLRADVEKYRLALVEAVIDHDSELADLYLEGKPIEAPVLKAAIRRCTIQRKFAPIFLGSAYKNKGVQPLLDGVVEYLPDPRQRVNYAYDISKFDASTQEPPDEAKVALVTDPKAPFVGLAFKLTETKFGQLTWMRVYQGTLKKGANVVNLTQKQRVRIPRLVRLHANEMQNVEEIGPGEICAVFGMHCTSGDAFSEKESTLAMSKMFVPEPVVHLGITIKDVNKYDQMIKVLQRFAREDPTFRVRVDQESGQVQISGMGELHLDIYMERLKREEGVVVVPGKPYVNYREAVTAPVRFDYFHKKQTGGAGQYAKIVGYMEPLPHDSPRKFEFVNKTTQQMLPPNYATATRKGFEEAVQRGPLLGCPVWWVRLVLEDGATHEVDSSELAFKIAANLAFVQAFKAASPTLLQPIMKVEVNMPSSFINPVLKGLVARKAVITHQKDEGGLCTLIADVPLTHMFGYTSEVRMLTSGRGECAMEYVRHDLVDPGELPAIYQELGVAVASTSTASSSKSQQQQQGGKKKK